MARPKKHFSFAECAKMRKDYVEHGSAKHRANIGLVEGMDLEPKAVAKLEAQLIEPPVVADRLPLTRQNYPPRTRRNPGKPIIDGWVRKGR